MPRWTVALFLFIAIPAFAGAQTGLVKAEKNLPLRAEPKAGGSVLEQLSRFQPVKVLDHKDKFAKVKTIKTDPSQSKEGWVLASYISDTGFVTVDDDNVNVRQGPGSEFPTIMVDKKPYPVFVLDVARNGWVKVLDVDGDRGWISPNSLAFKPRYVIVKNPQSNLRTGGGKDYEKFPVAFTAEKGVFLQIIEEKEGWLHVKHDGGQEGWISTKLVFGYADEEQPKPKVETTPRAKKSEPATTAKSKKSTTTKSTSTTKARTTRSKTSRTTTKKAS